MSDVALHAFGADKLSSLLRGLGGTRPADDQPLPHGPWDPVVHSAFERVSNDALLLLLGKLLHNPAIFELIGGWGKLVATKLDRVAGEPHPIPWRQAFVTTFAQLIVERAELIDHVATAAGAGKTGAAAATYLNTFGDDYCGTVVRFRLPPGLGPHPWWDSAVSGADLMIVAAHFAEAATQSARKGLGAALKENADKLMRAGSERL